VVKTVNPSPINHTRRARTTIAVATVGLLVVLLGAIAYASTTSGGASRAAAATTPNQLAGVIGHFAVLRNPASDSPPAELATAVAKAPASYGLQLGAARHASNTDSWLVPGSGWLCIAARDADGLGMSCTNAAGAEAGELALIERSQATGEERVIGACPDGFPRVSALGDTETVLGGAAVSESTYRMTVRNARHLTLE
jgi:hypothetical protein